MASLVDLISAVQQYAYDHRNDADNNGAWSIWVGDIHVAGELGDVITRAGATTFATALVAAKKHVDKFAARHRTNDLEEGTIMKLLDVVTSDGGVQVIYSSDDTNAVIRVRIKRDFYVAQSFAVVEVLAADWTWTDLVNEPAINWHGKTSQAGVTTEARLLTMAEDLAKRAEVVLLASK
jgi:hypothetical protein